MLKDTVELPKATPKINVTTSLVKTMQAVGRIKRASRRDRVRIIDDFDLEAVVSDNQSGWYMMTDEQYRQYLKAKIIIALGKFF
jgi:hypothetical protein